MYRNEILTVLICLIVGLIMGLVFGSNLTAREYDRKISKGKPIQIGDSWYSAEEVRRETIIWTKKDGHKIE